MQRAGGAQRVHSFHRCSIYFSPMLTHSSCVAENLGFHNSRPVAALVIFRSCLQWKTFQADRTVLFDKVSRAPLLCHCICLVFAVSDVCSLGRNHVTGKVLRIVVSPHSQIINAMGGQIERQQDNNACLSYWLSNTVTLLYLLQRNIKPASGGAYNARLRSPTSRSAHHPHPFPYDSICTLSELLRRTPVCGLLACWLS